MKLEPNRFENSKGLFGVFDVDYLSAFVGSCLRVNAVRHLGFTRVLVEVELGRGQGIMSPAFTGACFRVSSFRIWHFKLLRSLDLVNKFLIKILESRPSRIDLVIFTIAICQIQVRAAFLAQTFAIILAENLLRQIKQYLLPRNVNQVDLAAIDLVQLHVVRMKIGRAHV